MIKRIAAILGILATIVLLALPTSGRASGPNLHPFRSTINPYTMRVPAWQHLVLYGPGIFSTYRMDAWVDGGKTKGFHVNLLVFCMPAPYGSTDGSILAANEQDALRHNGNVTEVGTFLLANHFLTVMSTNSPSGSGDLQAYMVQDGNLWLFQVAARSGTQASWLPFFRQVFGTFRIAYTGGD